MQNCASYLKTRTWDSPPSQLLSFSKHCLLCSIEVASKISRLELGQDRNVAWVVDRTLRLKVVGVSPIYTMVDGRSGDPESSSSSGIHLAKRVDRGAEDMEDERG